MTTAMNLQFLRNGLLAVGVCGGLALGTFGFSAHAEARVPDQPAPEGLVAVCRGVQNLYDYEVEQEQSASGTFAKAKHHRAQIALQEQWETAGCDKYFGSISTIVSRPTIAVTPSLVATAK